MKFDVKTCRIISKQKIATDTYDFTLFAGELAQIAQPGQFVHIQVPGKTLRRPISICDVNKENNTLILEEQRLHEEKDKLIYSVSGDKIKAETLQKLIKCVSGREFLTEYDDELFIAHVDHITVVSRTEVVFSLKCGLNLKERLREQ